MVDVNIPDNQNEEKMQFNKNFSNALGKMIFMAVLGIWLLFSLTSIVYTIQPDEVGVVLRFGRYVRTTNPGLRFKLPWSIEKVNKVRVTHIFKEEFGFRTKKAGVRTEYYDSDDYSDYGLSKRMNLKSYVRKTGLAGNAFLAESLMLTGDLNAAEVEWIIQYKIKDPVAYSFNVRDMQGTIRNMAEAVMRQVVGDATVDEVITSGKDIIEEESKIKLQEVLDKLKTGIQVTSVVLQDVNPPTQVKASFNEVNEARQDKERFVNQAWQDYNRAIPRAKGEALKVIRNAEGYAIEKINRAKGDADRFLATLAEYKNAKDITKRRLYIDSIIDALQKVPKKIIVDSSVQGVLPLLNLNNKTEDK